MKHMTLFTEVDMNFGEPGHGFFSQRKLAFSCHHIHERL